MFVGGEFYNDTRWLVDKPTISTDGMTFLNGGKACLIVISDYLSDHGIRKILLPSYLCPSIVNTLEQCGLTCNYYQINPDFSIDMDDLVKKASVHQAVYFINYFGFLHSKEVQNYLAGLQQRGVMVVEDNAQAGFTDQGIGDFIFNSMRKLAPYDGGYLITPHDVSAYIYKYQGRLNRRLSVIRAYRNQLADYLYQGKGSHAELVQMYQLAEDYYDSDLVVEGDPQERHHIEHLDWERIRHTRRENYTYLLSLISDIPQLSPVFPALQEENMPLGMPVYVSGFSRNGLINDIGNAGIGLWVHWEEIISDKRLSRNPVAVDMAGRILTLVTDQRTSHKQIDTMVQKIMACLKSESS